MLFQFSSVSEFLAMNGHGVYVWACYTTTAVGLLALACRPRVKLAQFLKAQRKLQQHLAAKQQAQHLKTD